MDYQIVGTLRQYRGRHDFVMSWFSSLEGAIQTAIKITREQKIIGTLKIKDRNENLIKEIQGE